MGRRFIALAASVTLVALSAAGCHTEEPMPPQQQQMGNRISTIRKSSGGDWEKVSPEDRKYLTDMVGNERSAKMLIAPPPGAAHAAGGPVGMPGTPGAGNR